MDVIEGCVTVIAATPDTLEAVALIVLWPALTPATTPLEDTVATPGAEEVHVAVPVTSFVVPSL
jgi:hypothetical protein